MYSTNGLIVLTQGRPNCGAFERCTVIHLRPSNPKAAPNLSSPRFSLFLMPLSPLQTNCLVIIIISLDNAGCFQCPRWKLFSHAEVRSSSPPSTPKLFGNVCNITLLCFCTLDILDKVLVMKKGGNKNAGLRGFLDVQRNNTEYWCRLEVISVLPGVTWFSVWLLHSV